MLGYFAFPPNTLPTTSTSESNGEKYTTEQDDVEVRHRQNTDTERESQWEFRLKMEAESRQQQLAREKSEAQRGEEEWVRSGGILRDAEGKRDMVRTQAIRDELRLRAIEAELLRKWEVYEERWKALSAANSRDAEPIWTFQDIPWPVDTETPETLELRDLSVEKIENFLLGGLKVRGSRITKKDRVRSSLLRWHPDKMTGVLARAVNDEMEIIKQGISVVMLCLQDLNARLG